MINWKRISLFLTASCALMYAVMGIAGTQISAWSAFMWVLVVFINDLIEYHDGK